jgi:hypothetical protein
VRRKLNNLTTNLADRYRYLEPKDRTRWITLASVVTLLVVVLLFLTVRQCSRAAELSSERMQGKPEAATAQVRDAFFAVVTAMTGESPAPTVADAVARVAQDKGGASLQSVVDGTPLKFNPDKSQWATGRGGAAMGTVLVVGPAPPSFKERKVSLIGIGNGGMPLEIVAGQEPAWLSSAVTGPAK